MFVTIEAEEVMCIRKLVMDAKSRLSSDLIFLLLKNEGGHGCANTNRSSSLVW